MGGRKDIAVVYVILSLVGLGSPVAVNIGRGARDSLLGTLLAQRVFGRAPLFYNYYWAVCGRV